MRVRQGFRLLLLVAVTLSFTVFAIANRSAVEVRFYPLPYAMETPVFLLVLMSFALGLVLAWLLLLATVHKSRRLASKATLRSMALENELKLTKLQEDGRPRGKALRAPAP